MNKRAVGIGIILILLLALGILWMPVFRGRDITFSDITGEMAFENGNRIITGTTVSTAEGRTVRGGPAWMRFSLQGEGALEVHLGSKNCASIVPDTFVIHASDSPAEIAFDVYTEIDYLNVQLTGGEGTDVMVEHIALSNRTPRDRRFTISFAFIAFAVVSFCILTGRINREQAAVCFLLTAVAFFASVPCLKDDLNVGDDLYYHWERLTGLIASLRSGQFPAHVYPTMNNGYGGVAPVFYPDMFLYPSAFLVLAGSSMQYAIHVYLIAVNLLTAFAMYAFARHLVHDRNTALIASILYTLSTYRLTDLYTRSAFGEVLAMALLPLMLLLLLKVIYEDAGSWPMLSVLAALLLRAHMITTMFAALLCGGICLVSIRQILHERRIAALLLAVVGAVLLCVPILLPLYTMTKDGVTATMMQRTTALKAIEPAQLFFSTQSGLQGSWETEHLLFRAIEIGVPMLAGASLYFYETIRGNEKGRNRMITVLLVFGMASAFMSTTWFPWSQMDVLTKTVSKYIQFPWRLLLVTVCLFAVPAACMYAKIGSQSVLIVLAVSLGIALPLERVQTLDGNIIAYGRTPEWMQLFGDYNFEGTISSRAADRHVRFTGEAEVLEEHRAGSSVEYTVEAYEETTVLLPLYAFKGYQVTANDQPQQTFRGEENRLAFLLQPGNYRILARYTGLPVWRAGEAIGLITLLVLLGILLKIKKKRNPVS
ncbi:MAG: hypothetical protein IJ242_11335 [Clostridia bacterium]|nr:hypothetical protein [Clostridia bacterium]